MRLTLNVEKTKKVMEQNGWDEDMLADAIGVSRTQVNRVLRGKREPGNAFIAGLLHASGEKEFDQLFILTK